MRHLHRSVLTEAQRTVIRRDLAAADPRVTSGPRSFRVSQRRAVRHTIERQLRGRFSGRQWRMLRKELFRKQA